MTEKTTIQISSFTGTGKGAIAILNSISEFLEKHRDTRFGLALTVKEL